MASTQSTAGRAITNEVTITDLQRVGCRSAARANRTASPCPAVVGNQTVTARTKGVIFSVTFHNVRRVVNEGFPIQC